MVLSLLVSSRFQVLFHSPPGVLFTFPSRYYSLSVTWSYLAFWDGPHFFRQDFSCPDVLRILLALSKFRLQEFHLLCSNFPVKFDYPSRYVLQSLPQVHYELGLGFSDFARHYSRNHFCFLLLQVLRCFNSLGCLLISYVFAYGWYLITDTGLPHSDTRGSLTVYVSPRRFAVNCVLLLLYMPRHPPYALIRLIFFFRELLISTASCLLQHNSFVITTFQKDLSVCLSSVIQFSKNSRRLFSTRFALRISIPSTNIRFLSYHLPVIPQNQTGNLLTWVPQTSLSVHLSP